MSSRPLPLCFYLLCFCVGLTACGSSGGATQPDPSSPSVSSASAASESSVESSTHSSSISESSASSQSSLPTTSSSGDPYCTPAGSDPDRDGWGWEGNRTCVVRNSAADPDRGNQQTPLSEDLINANATPDAEAVYDYLRSIWGHKTLSGQQDLTWNDSVDMYQRVMDDTGKAPAIMGYDFMNYALNAGSGLNQTEEAIVHWERGGLVTFAWHWRDPLASSSPEFYTDRTNFEIPVSNGELDTQSDAFNAMQNDIDDIAAELQRLEDEGVVVLWRPLHEASGGWFWWGRPRTDGIPPAYAQVMLWRHLYDRLTHYHGLNNLIWVWNGQSAGWYPGDQYVDIVSLDIYDGAQNYESQVEPYHEAALYPLQTKMVALSENSNIPDPELMEAEGAWWLWFVVWNDGNAGLGVTDKNNFWTGQYYNTDEHKIHVYSHENIITLDELPAF